MWPKCPKCKKQNVRIIEIWSRHSITWEPNSKEDEGILEIGDAHHVNGECLDCGRFWKFRKIIQVKPEWWLPDKLRGA